MSGCFGHAVFSLIQTWFRTGLMVAVQGVRGRIAGVNWLNLRSGSVEALVHRIILSS